MEARQKTGRLVAGLEATSSLLQPAGLKTKQVIRLESWAEMVVRQLGCVSPGYSVSSTLVFMRAELKKLMS